MKRYISVALVCLSLAGCATAVPLTPENVSQANNVRLCHEALAGTSPPFVMREIKRRGVDCNAVMAYDNARRQRALMLYGMTRPVTTNCFGGYGSATCTTY